ncbi:hypothetical protein K435DRAFT_773243 [Dendrothele bispora CBS 962.96]|uniref:Uncharacterized protein n=1 Tax=Dendrothele bispora (strain CBS 962.96) TaxID=1314807 RepID=A0A4S8MU03_DENBC|nr:hypothetical protein K435DRAFT_773243 [Dendrothele bispora CBS 962.96]
MSHQSEVQGPQSSDDAFRKAAQELEVAMGQYKAEKRRGGKEEAKYEENVIRLMRVLGDNASDPLVQQYYYKKADSFANGGDDADTLTDSDVEENRTQLGPDGLPLPSSMPRQKRKDKKLALLEEVGRGLAIMVLSPMIAAGALLYGVGTFVKGLGNILTCGYIEKGIKMVDRHVERRREAREGGIQL